MHSFSATLFARGGLARVSLLLTSASQLPRQDLLGAFLLTRQFLPSESLVSRQALAYGFLLLRQDLACTAILSRQALVSELIPLRQVVACVSLPHAIALACQGKMAATEGFLVLAHDVIQLANVVVLGSHWLAHQPH